MNLRNRIKKLENTANINPDACRCPNAMVLIATPFARMCGTCGKDIDTRTWKHWRLIEPTPDLSCFAFALRRDDRNEFKDMPDEYFYSEIREFINEHQKQN